jgi:phosphatidylglycerol:prolipoprotein diacylglycerol transferase
VPLLLSIPWFKLEGWTIPGTSVGIQPFGLLVAFAVWIGTRSATRYGERNGMRGDVVQDCATHVVIIGFVLGHMFDLVVYYPEKLIHEPWKLLFIWENLSSFGGVFGSIVGGFYWSKKRGVPLLPIYECIAYGFPLAWIFGRMGCFVVHDHPGSETDFFLAVDNYQYPGLPVATRHDLGLYEVFWSIAVTLLFRWFGRKPRPWGFYSAWFALLYAPYRFFLDFLRVADETYSGLTPGHYASIFAFGIGVTMLFVMKKHGHDPLVPAVRLDSNLPWPPESKAALTGANPSSK